MEKNEFMTIPQLARLLGLSRIAVYNKVKSGEIKAVRIGRTYAINTKDIADILGKTLTKKSKEEIFCFSIPFIVTSLLLIFILALPKIVT